MVKPSHVLPLLFWTLLCALFFAPLLAGTAHLPDGDLSGQFHAFGLFQARELAAGRLPIWSPGSYAGIPFAADTQAAVFYPLRWLTILASLPWDFPFYALQLEGIVHIWLAGLFTYGLAYSITRQRWAGLLAAVAFGLGGYLTSYPLLQLAVLETITWLPLVLLLLRCGVARARPIPWLAGAAVVLGVSALAGHPQTFLHAAYLAAVYYLFQTVGARWSWKWVLAIGILLATITVGTATAAWLPALRYLSYTTRSEATYEFVSAGFPLLDYAQLLVPGTFSFWAPQYVGLAAVCLALFAWWGRRERLAGDRSLQVEITFWSLTALIAAWLSLGDKGILFELVHRLVPGFSLFRQQERLVNVFSLSLALLAAQGLVLWQQTRPDRRRHWLRPTASIVAVGLLLTGLILALAQPEVDGGWWFIWGRQGLVAVAVLGLLWAGSKQRWGSFLLILLLAVDLFLALHGQLNLQPGSPAVFWPRPAWLDALPEGVPARVDSSQLFYLNLGEIYGLEDVRGLSPLKPQVLEKFEELPRPLRWQLLNVTHVLASSPIEDELIHLETIPANSLPGGTVEASLYRFSSARPRAWMSYRPLLAPDAEAAFAMLQAPEFDPATEVVLHNAAADLAAIQPPDTPPEVHTTRPAPNVLSIAVRTESAGLLVVSQWHYPGWRATVDGRPAPILTANYALQAVLLPAGSHLVTLRFLPADVPAGIAGTILALLGAGAAGRIWRPVIARRQGRLQRVRVAAWPGVVWPARVYPILVGLTTFLAFALRLFRLGDQELRGDEAFSYFFARLPAAGIVPALLDAGDPHSPLHYFLLHGWLRLAGDSEFAMRILSLVPGVLLIPLLARLSRRVLGPRLGCLAALLAAVSPSLVWLSQDVRNQYTLALVLVLLSTLLLTRNAPASSNRWAAVGLWALYAVTCALAVYSHYYAAFALIGHALYLLLRPGCRRALLPWLLSGSVACLLFVPWLVAMWPQLVAAGQLSDPARPELAGYLTAVGVESTVGAAFDHAVGRWLFLGALALCLAGGRLLFRERPAWAAFLLGWLGTTALAIFLVQFKRATFNPFYISLVAPAWWLLVAAGILALWRHGQARRLLSLLAVAGLLLAAGISLSNYYFKPLLFGRDNGYRGIAAHLAANRQPGDLFLTHFPDPALSYYLRNLDLPQQMQPATADASQTDTEAALAALTAGYSRLWFVPHQNESWDAENVVPRWLDYHTLQEQRLHSQKLTLVAYRPLHAVDQVWTPVGARIDDAIRLTGVFVTVDGVPANLQQPIQITPGATLAVTLVWDALRPQNENDTVFVHLLDENGVLLAQHDGIPASGTRPTTTWEVGERLLDRHELSIPPATAARQGSLLVGLYEAESLERRLFVDGRDALPIAPVHFEPP